MESLPALSSLKDYGIEAVLRLMVNLFMRSDPAQVYRLAIDFQ
jgi:hypothetical protein